MVKRDMIDDLVDLVHPVPDRSSVSLVDPDGYRDDPDGYRDDPDGYRDDPDGPNGDAELVEDAFAAWCDAVEQRRREFEENLRTVQDAGPIVLAAGEVPDVDPLIAEIERARNDQQEAEDRLRLLLAYARKFTVRGYSLSELAQASGMSISGVRTAYTPAEVGRVYARLGRKPVDVVGLRSDAGGDKCAVIAGNRTQRATNCVGTPTTIGGAPGTDQQFLVCDAHAYLVSNPRPITDDHDALREQLA